MNIFTKAWDATTGAWHATLQFLHIEDKPVEIKDEEKLEEFKKIEIEENNLKTTQEEVKTEEVKTAEEDVKNENVKATEEVITNPQVKKPSYITKTDVDLKDNGLLYFTEETDFQNLDNQESFSQDKEIMSFAEDNYNTYELIQESDNGGVNSEALNNNSEAINDQPQNIIDLNISF